MIGGLTVTDEPWRDRARCADLPPQLFDDCTDDARAVCDGCPVRSECLEAAMSAEGRLGARDRGALYGGLDPGERAQLQRDRDAAAAKRGERVRRRRANPVTPSSCRRCGGFARTALAHYCARCAEEVDRENLAARRARAS